MFYRRANLDILSVLEREKEVLHWKDVVRLATATGISADHFLKEGEFDWDPENFIYFRARSVDADIPNGNGDFWEKAELDKNHKTLAGKGFYIEHNSKSVENAKGIILDAVWFPDQKYVQCLVAVDKKAHPDIARQIETGIV